MRTVAAVVACFVVLAWAAPPAEAQSRDTVGWISIAAGSGLVLGAFNYEGDICPDGYSTHRYQHQTTQCYYESPGPPYDTDLRDASVRITFERPGLMWAGIGAIGLGAVLLTLPENPVTRDLDVQVSPQRFAVRRSFGW